MTRPLWKSPSRVQARPFLGLQHIRSTTTNSRPCCSSVNSTGGRRKQTRAGLDRRQKETRLLTLSPALFSGGVLSALSEVFESPYNLRLLRSSTDHLPFLPDTISGHPTRGKAGDLRGKHSPILFRARPPSLGYRERFPKERSIT